MVNAIILLKRFKISLDYILKIKYSYLGISKYIQIEQYHIQTQ